MIVVLLALGTLLGACGSSKLPDPTNPPARSHATSIPGSERLLEGTEWTLTSGTMSQEQRYLDLLRDVDAFYIYGAQLWPKTDDSRTLVFGVRP
jgi:hypothetical protein